MRGALIQIKMRRAETGTSPLPPIEMQKTVRGALGRRLLELEAILKRIL